MWSDGLDEEWVPNEYIKLESKLKQDIEKNGFLQTDRRMGRKTMSFPGHFIVVKDPKIIGYLIRRGVLRKYVDDWNRMIPSFLSATHQAKYDPDSRQLMVFNDENYKHVHQCFTHMQFVMTHRKEFDLYVYQRSSDMVKLKEDLTFFAHVARAFADEVGKKVTKIVVVYGHIHFTKNDIRQTE